MLDTERAGSARLPIDLRVRGMQPSVARIQQRTLVVEDALGQRVDSHISVDPVLYLLLVFNRVKPWKPTMRDHLVTWARHPWRVNGFGSLLHV